MSNGLEHIVSIKELSVDDIEPILDLAEEMVPIAEGKEKSDDLEGKILATLFFEPSTRTRISFAAGISDLGSNSVFMDQKQLQLKRGESLKDTAKVLSSYLDAITIRSLNHEKVKELAREKAKEKGKGTVIIGSEPIAAALKNTADEVITM